MVKMLKNKKREQSDSLVMLSIKYLEVEPIVGVLQELSIRVNEGVCIFSKTNVIGRDDEIWSFMGRTDSTL